MGYSGILSRRGRALSCLLWIVRDGRYKADPPGRTDMDAILAAELPWWAGWTILGLGLLVTAAWAWYLYR